MPMMHAKRFIKQAVGDWELRDRLNSAADQAERETVLKELDLAFSDDEFDEAFRSLEVNCPSREQHELLQEFRMWWDMLRQT